MTLNWSLSNRILLPRFLSGNFISGRTEVRLQVCVCLGKSTSSSSIANPAMIYWQLQLFARNRWVSLFLFFLSCSYLYKLCKCESPDFIAFSLCAKARLDNVLRIYRVGERRSQNARNFRIEKIAKTRIGVHGSFIVAICESEWEFECKSVSLVRSRLHR